MNGLRMHHFVSVFQKIKNRGGTPPPCERKGKTSPVSRISEIGTLTAKITHNFGEKSTGNRQKLAKNAPFASVFQKFSGDPETPPYCERITNYPFGFI